jgi:hypothetical protein
MVITLGNIFLLQFVCLVSEGAVDQLPFEQAAPRLAVQYEVRRVSIVAGFAADISAHKRNRGLVL